MREIELKEIHLKSQENLLLRREKEIEDFKRNESNNPDDNSFIKKLQTLESEKEKLVMENLNLINLNSNLNSQAKGLKEHLHNTVNAYSKSSKFEGDQYRDFDGNINVKFRIIQDIK